jgi:hypothetical protein
MTGLQLDQNENCFENNFLTGFSNIISEISLNHCDLGPIWIDLFLSL